MAVPARRGWGRAAWRAPADRPAGYFEFKTFHPTFLYEFVYDVAMVGVLLLVDRFFRIRRPALFALYVSLYTLGRFFEELLRIDPAHHIGPLRLNAWVSIIVFCLAVAGFVWSQRRAERPAAPTEPNRPRMAIPKGRVRHGR